MQRARMSMCVNLQSTPPKAVHNHAAPKLPLMTAQVRAIKECSPRSEEYRDFLQMYRAASADCCSMLIAVFLTTKPDASVGVAACERLSEMRERVVYYDVALSSTKPLVLPEVKKAGKLTWIIVLALCLNKIELYNITRTVTGHLRHFCLLSHPILALATLALAPILAVFAEGCAPKQDRRKVRRPFEERAVCNRKSIAQRLRAVGRGRTASRSARS
eukprot:1243631-Pleurochrysis_carterae.AAC.2